VDDTGPKYKAGLTYMAGLEHEPKNEELKDGARRAAGELDKPMGDEGREMYARMMEDPEVVAIMSDPVILKLLNESDPATAAAHLKNAGVAAAKVQMLVDAGFIIPEK
jgi:stress-induced-phosphoprotein 1